MPLPKYLKPFRSEALELLHQGAVSDLEFSGPTYQVAVNKEWVFLQFDTHDHLKDGFCTCKDEGAGCAHMAAAYLHLFDGHELPLHRRFELSLFYALFYALSETWGGDPSLFTLVGKGRLRLKEQLIIEGAAKKIKELFSEKPLPTEETSLKFSNLSQEEIARWREGDPTPQLSFELSFWSDLAKWFFLQPDVALEFEGIPPHQLTLRSKELTLTCQLDVALLEKLIPTLPTVKSPYQVFGLKQEGIESLYFDPIKKRLHSTQSARRVEPPQGEALFSVGEWLFAPSKGFFAKSGDKKASHRILEGDEIADLFDHFLLDVKRLLKEVEIHGGEHPLSYELFIDRFHNLHIRSFLFEAGDLLQSDTLLFKHWVFLPQKGFFRIEKRRFVDFETVIPAEEVSSFIGKERAWLSEHPGFETHQMSVEAKLTYHVDASNVLHFSSFLSGFDEKEEVIDYGLWIYIKGEGFYPKSSHHGGLEVRPGMAIPPQSVTLFIKSNHEELSLLPDFFAKKAAVVRSGLLFELSEKKNILIKLKHELRGDLSPENVRFYDDYAFVLGEGFSKLPVDPRLLERVSHDIEIPKKERDSFYRTLFPELYPFALSLPKELTPTEKLSLVVESIQKEEGKFNVKLSFKSVLGEVSFKELYEALAEKREYAFTDAGAIDLHVERFLWLKEMVREKSLLFTPLDLIRLSALESPLFRSESVHEAWNQAVVIGASEEKKETAIHATLRPYQENGVKWLLGLYEHGLSGILCDDMGLGKTLQALELIAKVRKGHALIIAPTSVLYHWQDKIHQFFPEAKLFTFYGADRSLKGFQNRYDILLTSYGILRREIELLKQIPFEFAVFDEVQMAKNSKSKLHAALKKVNAKMRFGLTGTPIENHLVELKALFDLTLPHYLPGEQQFRSFFQIPIEKMQDAHRKEILSKMIHPFILRRVKSEVLLDLPEKIEEITYCPLLKEQHELYQAALKAREPILEELNQGNRSSALHVFSLLARLKQICDHPAVYLQDVEGYQLHKSGKWQRLEEILEEAIESGQKVVIFSQYLRQLDIFGRYLKEKGIGFAEIRGATQNREGELRRFHEDPDCKVFIASLQAAGLGIDLTPASVVIHYDRWWNAARENQATDRVHRMGQKRGVQVFKFVTRGTFEERIHAMIEKKGKLMEEVVGIDDQELIKNFTRDELIELLKDVKLTEEDQITYLED